MPPKAFDAHHSKYETVPVVTASASYDILIGANLLATAGENLADVLAGKKICIVTDENVAKLYMAPLTAALQAAGFIVSAPIILPAGEESKSFAQLQYIIESCLSRQLDRQSTLIALGGGVVGDITGFAAAILMRGVPFVQIPTTLLAQVDSSVGGKTAINTEAGKNLVGAFYQPRRVLIDTQTLKTLPPREMKAGYAEVLKYALINDPDFFDWLDKNATALLAGDEATLSDAICTSCRTKAAVVTADEREEKDIRVLLNLGHTFGHALESLGGYDGRLLHGEAVGIGLGMAYDFSAALGLCPKEDAKKVVQHLAKTELMTAPPFDVRAQEVLEKMRGDKKARAGQHRLILTRGLGKAYVAQNVDEDDLLRFLETRFSSAV